MNSHQMFIFALILSFTEYFCSSKTISRQYDSNYEFEFPEVTTEFEFEFPLVTTEPGEFLSISLKKIIDRCIDTFFRVS